MLIDVNLQYSFPHTMLIPVIFPIILNYILCKAIPSQNSLTLENHEGILKN